ncbi:MAG: hypothetical protein H0T94_08920 [Acidimicrobiia bacterium]|nr:hypothetical protein [Acidimicrobiia bacterium]
MRAAIAEGNQTALDATFAELLAVVDADQGPDAAGFLDPETQPKTTTPSRLTETSRTVPVHRPPPPP